MRERRAAQSRPARWAPSRCSRCARQATPEEMQAAIRNVVGEAPVKKGRVKLDMPPLVENGNTVPLTVTVESPMTAHDHVKAIHVFNEKNPQPNVIGVHLGPRAGRAAILDPHPARRHADGGRDRGTERRLVLVRQRRRHRHAGGLPGGRLDGPRPDQRPAKAKRGEVIEIKTLISHVDGDRLSPRRQSAQAIPRDIISRFVCTYNGEEVFRADLYPGDRRQPVHQLLCNGDRERHARVPVDRRQRLSSETEHGRASPSNEGRSRRRFLADGAGRRMPPGSAAFVICRRGFACLGGRDSAGSDRRSGYADHEPETRAMQDDDTANPGMLWVLEGEALWSAEGRGRQPLMRRLPRRRGAQHEGAWRRAIRRSTPARPAHRSRTADQHLPRRAAAGAAVALREPGSARADGLRGAPVARLPIARQATQRLAPFIDAGRDFFDRRQGQLNLSCAQCHDDNWGKRLAGNVVPQGHPTGYPLYRLEWQSLGSLQRRLRNCISGMRAEVRTTARPNSWTSNSS